METTTVSGIVISDARAILQSYFTSIANAPIRVSTAEISDVMDEDSVCEILSTSFVIRLIISP